MRDRDIARGGDSREAACLVHELAAADCRLDRTLARRRWPVEAVHAVAEHHRLQQRERLRLVPAAGRRTAVSGKAHRREGAQRWLGRRTGMEREGARRREGALGLLQQLVGDVGGVGAAREVADDLHRERARERGAAVDDDVRQRRNVPVVRGDMGSEVFWVRGLLGQGCVGSDDVGSAHHGYRSAYKSSDFLLYER